MKYKSDFRGLFNALENLKHFKELVINSTDYENPVEFSNKLHSVLKEFSIEHRMLTNEVDFIIIKLKDD